MGWNFRKNIKFGPARINLSKSGIGYSVGAGGLRFTHSPKRRAGSKKKHPGDGFIVSLIKLCFCLCLLAVAAYLVTAYWKWLVALAAIAVVATIVYQIYIYKKIHPKTKDDSEFGNNDPAS